MKGGERIVYMDAARSILISLGVVLHSAQVYASDTIWIVKDARVSPFFAALADGIHVFRMPAFFFISGFFCALTLLRFGRRRFFQGRMVRVVVPLTVVSFLINAPLALWLVSNGYIAIDPRDPTAWVQGKLWLFHLWFLANLILYFLLASMFGERAVALLRSALDSLERRGAGRTVQAAVGLGLVTLLYLTVVPVHLTGGLYRHLAFFGTYFDLVRYLCPFLLGFAVYADERFAAAYFARGWISIPIWAAVSAVVLSTQGSLQVLAEHIGIITRDLSATYLTLLLFRRLVTEPSRTAVYAANAAYTIYLLHHPLVILFGIALLGASLPIGIKFLLVCLGSLGVCLVLHHFIVLRSPLFGFLFNGRIPQGRPLPLGKSGP